MWNKFISGFCKVKFLCFAGNPNWLGWGLLVLAILDLSKNKIDLILIEAHGYNENTKRSGELIFDIMKRNNFKKLYGDYPDNLIFKNFN